MATLPIHEQLDAAETAIIAASDENEIRAALALFGYDAATLQEGAAILQTARDAVKQRALRHSEALKAVIIARQSARSAAQAFQRLAEVARAVQHQAEAGMLTALGLTEHMPRTPLAFLAVADHLWQNAALPPSAPLLGRYGYGAANLASEYQQIAAYRAAYRAQLSAQAQAIRATSLQREALRALALWMQQFRRIAKVALAATPELLPFLGIPKRKPRTRPAPPSAVGEDLNRQDAKDLRTDQAPVDRADEPPVGVQSDLPADAGSSTVDDHPAANPPDPH